MNEKTQVIDERRLAQYVLPLLEVVIYDRKITPAAAEEMVRRADTPYGKVAALQVAPTVLEVIKPLAGEYKIPVTSVAADEAEARMASAAKVAEIGLIFPYERWLMGDLEAPKDIMKGVEIPKNIKSVFVMETTKLRKELYISEACRDALRAGVDWLQMAGSLGKDKETVTSEQANAMLEAIQIYNELHGDQLDVGFKAGGVVRSLAEAEAYVNLGRSIMGALNKKNFRILGTVGLLEECLNVLT